MKPIRSAFYILFLSSTFGCGLFYDPKLKTPDCCGGGYNLTALGSLVYGPWLMDPDARNEKIYFNEQELSSKKAIYTLVRQELVFELLQDGSVNYWFKDKYNSPLKSRTVPDKNRLTTVSDEKPKKDEIGEVTKGGKWNANFKDSSLTIDFGKGIIEIPSLKGKYTDLGSNYVVIQETTYFDSLYNKKMVKLKKVITTGYIHPWLQHL